MAGVTTATKEVEQQQEVTLCNRTQEDSASSAETQEDSASSAETVAVIRVQEGIENPMEQMGEPHKGPDLLVEDMWEDRISIQTASQRWTGGEP